MVKAVLIDDEPIVIRGIKTVINWNNLGIQIVGTAEDGIEGLKLIKEVKPDIVLTDIRMPRMNGLTLVETVKLFAPETVFIIFSSYQEFHYVQTAISLGVIDYLDKPITVEKLEQTLLKARNMIEERRFHLASDEYLLRKNEVSINAVSELMDYERIENMQLLEKINFYETSKVEGEKWAAIIIKGVNGKLIEDIEYNLVKVHIDETFKECKSEPLIIKRPKSVTLLVTWENVEDFVISELLQSFLRLCNGSGIEVIIGYGKAYPGISGVIKSYMEAEKALKYAEFIESEEPVSIDQIEFSYTIPVFLSRNKDSLTMDIRFGNKEKVIDSIEKFTAELKTFNLPHDFFCHQCLDLVYLAFQVSAETGNNFITEYQPDFNASHVIYGFATVEKLSKWLCNFFSLFMDWIIKQRKNSGHHSINLAKNYISENYNKDISLTELSEKVNMNPTYLSVLFKDTVGMSYIKYVTKIRLDRAKEFLLQGNKVAEVSKMVGYYDYRYFCDIFKKYTGVTPNQYKSV